MTATAQRFRSKDVVNVFVQNEPLPLAQPFKALPTRRPRTTTKFSNYSSSINTTIPHGPYLNANKRALERAKIPQFSSLKGSALDTVGDSDYVNGSTQQPTTVSILNNNRKQKMRNVSDTKQLFTEQFKFINNDPSLQSTAELARTL